MENINYREAKMLAYIPEHPSGEIVSYHFGEEVSPSKPGQHPDPVIGGQVTRANAVEAYTYETSLFLEDDDSGSAAYVAYPTEETKTFDLPGTREPIEIVWQVNSLNRKGVVHLIELEEAQATIPCFPGLPYRLEELIPDKDQATLWTTPPQVGDKILCWIGYCFVRDDHKLIAYAYPAKEEKVVADESGNQTWPREYGALEYQDGTLIIPGEDAEITNKNIEGGRIQITVIVPSVRKTKSW